MFMYRGQWPGPLRRVCAASCLLGMWVRILLGSWMSVVSGVCCQKESFLGVW